ncbi:Dipicolinate synthase subunit A [bioreactor metagenome]|uniref:Dipicolinate synthase subunit A n=1 Tax=bioreactor metagenome TaxID=1076179 RepID=A0A645C0J5_9ZZZZ
MLSDICPHSLVVGGKLCSEAENILSRSECDFFPLLEDDEFSKLNAIPTAEGILSLVIKETDFLLSDASVLVFGSGRVAQAVLKLFYRIPKRLWMCARNDAALISAAEAGFGTMKFPPDPSSNAISDFDIIINTIPSFHIISEQIVSSFKKSAIYFELASGKDNIDAVSAEKNSVRVVFAHSLPGKFAPRTAAGYIAHAIERYKLER